MQAIRHRIYQFRCRITILLVKTDYLQYNLKALRYWNNTLQYRINSFLYCNNLFLSRIVPFQVGKTQSDIAAKHCDIERKHSDAEIIHFYVGMTAYYIVRKQKYFKIIKIDNF